VLWDVSIAYSALENPFRINILRDLTIYLEGGSAERKVCE